MNNFPLLAVSVESHSIDVYTRYLYIMLKADNLQGALQLLVLKILRRRANHGFAISSYIQQTSDEVLRVEAGSLYPALHRMTEAGLLKAQWRMSAAGRALKRRPGQWELSSGSTLRSRTLATECANCAKHLL